MKARREKLLPRYFTGFEFLTFVPIIPMQIKIYIRDEMGDIRPTNILPNRTGFLRKAFSISHENSRQKRRNMVRQNNAMIKIRTFIIILTNRLLPSFSLIRKIVLVRISKVMLAGAIGIYSEEYDASINFPESQP
jgi:hypothetical protein